jgi:cytochrome c oxidase assembly factor CtaG
LAGWVGPTANLSLSDYQGRTNLLILISVLLIAVILAPPIDAVENTNLTARMIECTLLVVYSISLGYGLERLASGPAAGSRERRWGMSVLRGLIVPGVVLAFWNYPPNFDATVVNTGLRYVADATYLLVGMLVGMTVSIMPRGFRAGALLLTFLSVGMMGSMMLVWQPGFYTSYSPAQNLESNSFLMGMGALGVLTSGSWTLKVLDIV